jgi:nucleoside phosphorylase
MAADDVVAVRTFINVFEAEIAQTALEAAGIESVIHADDCGGLRPHLQLGGVGLMVRPEDVVRAEEVLTAEAAVIADDEA